MICTHVKKLYQVCEQEGLRLSSSDLIHIVCDQCGVQEVCPSMKSEEYDHMQDDAASSRSDDEDASPPS